VPIDQAFGVTNFSLLALALLALVFEHWLSLAKLKYQLVSHPQWISWYLILGEELSIATTDTQLHVSLHCTLHSPSMLAFCEARTTLQPYHSSDVLHLRLLSIVVLTHVADPFR
jgi:hypothetical protein